jgi:hypothetical protein
MFQLKFSEGSMTDLACIYHLGLSGFAATAPSLFSKFLLYNFFLLKFSRVVLNKERYVKASTVLFAHFAKDAASVRLGFFVHFALLDFVNVQFSRSVSKVIIFKTLARTVW